MALGLIAAGFALLFDEKISSLWIVTASICAQLIGYRFYSAFLTAKVLVVDPKRTTPAKKFADGRDFIPTNKWIVFGHHFAAIAGPGPLIGPTLAAQFGYLPGILWILIGGVLGGAVQDLVILFASVRRDGKSLGQMIKDEIGDFAGVVALIGTFAIIIILISVLGLIIVKALKHSPWGSFTVFATIPIAMLIGVYLYYLRPGRVLEASIIGVALFLGAVYFGKIVNYDPALAKIFDRSGEFIAWSIMIYGFLAACLPMWLLLAPRDYLSSFLKVGTIGLLAIAIICFHPVIKMPAFTEFVNGAGPVFSGKIFPFLFITIACGAISGFHALVASGTTPKIISSEGDIRLVGYGSMLLESFVAIMAIIAASILDPGIYFAINSSPAAVGVDAATAVQTITQFGYPVSVEQMTKLAADMGEQTMFARTGGAPSLAVGMAQILSLAFGRFHNASLLAIWYHFAIMFEAVFILTTLDAGTRVARFMLQDILNQTILKKRKRSEISEQKHPSLLFNLLTSFLVVASWGYFLYLGVVDPSGGVNILWPLFGMSNQMLAGIALALALVIVAKNKPKYIWVVALPLVFIVITTTSSVLIKVFSPNIKIGFLALANHLQYQLDSGIEQNIALTSRLIFNQRLIATIALIFMAILWVVVLAAVKKLIMTSRLNK